MMEGGTCVACGEMSEGKPLYKKLGNNLDIEVYDALIKMQLLSLPELEKKDLYICWDCDETIAEEYTNFVETEKRRISDEKKRKVQDEVRTQKTNKKLQQAFKKVHKETMISKGDLPPVSKYKEKEQKKVANRYYANNCILCRNPFKSSKTGFLRFNMKKMIEDHCNVYEALQKLGTDLIVEPNVHMRRFICCQCYNKVRRDYKTRFKDININPTSNHIPPYTNGSAQPLLEANAGSIKRPTFNEHAAEIAKLIPPGLADMYKVIGKDVQCPAKKVDVLDDLSYTDTESDSDTSVDSVSGARIWKTTVSVRPKKTIRTFIPKKSGSSQNMNISSSKSNSGICLVCGICYRCRPKSFWFSLRDQLPSIPNLTVYDAVKALESPLIGIKYKRNKESVCKSCYRKICTGFQEVCPNYFIQNPIYLRGPGKIVEIDESCFS